MRNLSTPMIAQITYTQIAPVIMVDLTLKTGVTYIWSGIGSITYNGNTYLGVGSLGQLGDISEGTAVKADGTSLTLSGIDPALMADCISDIQLGAPVTVWFALLSSGAVVSTPYPVYVGTVDRPDFSIGADSISIRLNLENKMVNLQRATNRRYTTSDQRYYYSDDIGFSWVETLNDIALRWA